MRVLVVTNLTPDAAAPQRGRWVQDQIDETRRLGVDVEVFSFPVGKGEYGPATRHIRGLLRRERFDLVHAHYGLAGWCARLAGARPLIVTFHGTDVRHPVVGPMSRLLSRRIDLAAGVSRSLFSPEAGRRGLTRYPGASAVLPCGADLERFQPMPMEPARRELDLDPDGRYLFFPANPERAEKRHDRALAVAEGCGAELLTGGGIDPDLMPLWLNAAGAVIITSDYEGFGLACLEAVACGRPVLSTPVGIAPFVLRGLPGALCAPFDAGAWADAASGVLEDDPPASPEGASRVQALSAEAMAARVVESYSDILRHDGGRRS